jgi:hypothetical protein
VRVQPGSKGCRSRQNCSDTPLHCRGEALFYRHFVGTSYALLQSALTLGKRN